MTTPRETLTQAIVQKILEHEPDSFDQWEKQQCARTLQEFAVALRSYYAIHQGGSDPTRKDCDCGMCEKAAALVESYFK